MDKPFSKLSKKTISLLALLLRISKYFLNDEHVYIWLFQLFGILACVKVRQCTVL